MKRILLILVIASLFSCSDESLYEYGRSYAVPDSLVERQRAWIVEETKAATPVGAGDYEDPEYLVRTIVTESIFLFGVQMEGVYKKSCGQCGWDYNRGFIPYEKLTKEEKELFLKLKEDR